MSSDSDEGSRLLTVEDVAARLNVSGWSVYKLLRRRKLPGVRVGGAWRVAPEKLEAFIKRGGAR